MENLDLKENSQESLYENMTDGNQCLGSHQVDTRSDEEPMDESFDEKQCSCDINSGEPIPNTRTLIFEGSASRSRKNDYRPYISSFLNPLHITRFSSL